MFRIVLHVATRPGPISEVVRDALAASLRRHGGNVRKAADELGINYRTAHRWVTTMGLRQTLRRQRRKAATTAVAA